jgi:hypothetical protein
LNSLISAFRTFSHQLYWFRNWFSCHYNHVISKSFASCKSRNMNWITNTIYRFPVCWIVDWWQTMEPGDCCSRVRYGTFESRALMEMYLNKPLVSRKNATIRAKWGFVGLSIT